MGVHGKRDIDAGRDIAGRDVRTEVNIEADASGDPRNTRAGVAVRLAGLEDQFSRFAEIQASEWGNVRSELRATREQIEDMMQADAVRRARSEVELENDRNAYIALNADMQDVKAVLFGNGKLGTVRWEKITRAMAMFAILVVIVILVMVLLQGVQIAQMQQQISVIMEALP